MISAPLPADPLAPYTIEELRSGDELDCVVVTGPAIGRVKMPRTDPDRGRARAESLKMKLNVEFGNGYRAYTSMGADHETAREAAGIEVGSVFLRFVDLALSERRRNPEPGTRNPQPPQEAAL